MSAQKTLNREGARLVGTLYNNYKADVFRYLLSRLKKLETAEDITSKVFLNAAKEVVKNRYQDKGQPKAWLMKIAHNEMVNHFRSMNGKKSIRLGSGEHEYDLRAEEMNPHQIVASSDATKNLSALVDRLPKAQKRVFNLRFHSGMPFKEMSEKLGVRSSTLRGQHLKAKAALRSMLNVEKHLLDP